MKKAIGLFVVAASAFVGAHEATEEVPPLTFDGLVERFGWNFETAELTTRQVADGLHVLFGLGGNVVASIGEDGVLIVDDMFPQLVPKLNDVIAELGGDGVDIVVNTHWHFDHAEGNLALGPAGASIVAHDNSAKRMAHANIINLVSVKYHQQAYPPEARPLISFNDRMRFYFNGDEIDIVHFGPAHTTGDVAVIFRNRNVVHAGDVFNNTGYPFVDADNGGGIDGMIAFSQAILDEIGPDAVVVPGHGEVADSAALQRYIDMMTTVRNRVAEQIAAGKNLAETIASQPAAGFEETFGPAAAATNFVDRVYTSLKRDGVE